MYFKKKEFLERFKVIKDFKHKEFEIRETENPVFEILFPDSSYKIGKNHFCVAFDKNKLELISVYKDTLIKINVPIYNCNNNNKAWFCVDKKDIESVVNTKTPDEVNIEINKKSIYINNKKVGVEYEKLPRDWLMENENSEYCFSVYREFMRTLLILHKACSKVSYNALKNALTNIFIDTRNMYWYACDGNGVVRVKTYVVPEISYYLHIPYMVVKTMLKYKPNKSFIMGKSKYFYKINYITRKGFEITLLYRNNTKKLMYPHSEILGFIKKYGIDKCKYIEIEKEDYNAIKSYLSKHDFMVVAFEKYKNNLYIDKTVFVHKKYYNKKKIYFTTEYLKNYLCHYNKPSINLSKDCLRIKENLISAFLLSRE